MWSTSAFAEGIGISPELFQLVQLAGSVVLGLIALFAYLGKNSEQHDNDDDAFYAAMFIGWGTMISCFIFFIPALIIATVATVVFVSAKVLPSFSKIVFRGRRTMREAMATERGLAGQNSGGNGQQPALPSPSQPAGDAAKQALEVLQTQIGSFDESIHAVEHDDTLSAAIRTQEVASLRKEQQKLQQQRKNIQQGFEQGGLIVRDKS